MKQDTLEGKAKTKNGIKRLCFSIICILLEVIFIITIVTRLNEYAEIINLFTGILSGILVLRLYASDKTSSMKMPWVILILIFPIMGVGLYLLIGLNGGTHKMRERYAEVDSKSVTNASRQSGVFKQNKRKDSESRKYCKLHTKKFAVSNLSEYGY